MRRRLTWFVKEPIIKEKKQMKRLLIGGLLLAVVGLAHGEQDEYVPVMDYITQGERLLDETSIGEDLIKSPNPKVEELVRQARKLLNKARLAHFNGRHYRAKKFAKGATRMIYEADRIFYNLEYQE